MGPKESDKCYALEDGDLALFCIKEVVRTAKGECRPKLVLLTQENCIPCQEQKDQFKTDLDSGIIHEVGVTSEEGISIIKKNGIEFIPSLLLLDCRDNIILPSV